MIEQLLLLFLLIMLSGFFSSSETALFSISTVKARHLAKDEGPANQLIAQMKKNPHTLLSTILIGNNLVNVAASAIATSLAINLFSSHAVAIATGIMTFLILVFGEIFPKSIATRNNILIARMVIYPIYWLSFLFFPVIKFMDFIPKLTGKIKRTPAVTEEELMTFVEVGEEHGEIKEQEKEFIHNIFEFDDTSASEIMIPRGDMFVIEEDKPLSMQDIFKSGYTRIPVIREDYDHVVGILNIKDLFAHQVMSSDPVNISNLMQEPYFIPENKKIDELLQTFKQRKHHMAIVVDEHGGVSGLITLEDVLEEIVGEIRDETDKEEPHITNRRPKEWIVLGKSDIDEVNDVLGMGIPDSKEYDTFSGFVLDQIGRIPQENEQIDIGDFHITVKERDGNRIKKYLVRHQ
jgi:CBS domain containing-hemolysin-like protein